MQLTYITKVCFLLIAFAVCGGNYAGALSGNLSTPNYPLSYPDNSNCIWIIHCPYNHYVTVSLPIVIIEKDKTCAFDYLVFFDGSSPGGAEITPRKSGTYLQQNKICGEWSDLTWRSSGRSITAKFVSDDSTSAKGFAGAWSCTLDKTGWFIYATLLRYLTKIITIAVIVLKVLNSFKNSAVQ